jgi:hypothetical protein
MRRLLVWMAAMTLVLVLLEKTLWRRYPTEGNFDEVPGVG